VKKIFLRLTVYVSLIAVIILIAGCDDNVKKDSKEPDVSGIEIKDASEWETAVNDIKNGGDGEVYTLKISGSFTAPSTKENMFRTAKNITINIQGSGTVSSAINGSLLRIGEGQTVILKNVALQGHSGNDSPVIEILSGGLLQMEGNAKVTGNTNSTAGGIHVNGGMLIMQEKASVTGNTKLVTFREQASGGIMVSNGGTFWLYNGTVSENDGHEGGVFIISGGTFIMEGGSVSDNSGSSGVFVGNGTFTMKDGVISGNTADENGGGVYILRSTFDKLGGIIYGNEKDPKLSNAAGVQGHALYWDTSPVKWRNETAGLTVNTLDPDFWKND